MCWEHLAGALVVASQLVTQEMHFPQSKAPGAQPAQAGMGRGGCGALSHHILS